MMRSMFTAVSGLRTHQTKMDVIGNNIANVNTTGYKSASVTFKDIFSQTIQGGSAASDQTGRGGVNPMQIGLGVAIASIDNVMTQGAAQTTDNPLDIMINGDSFFIVGDDSGKYFTRAGAFRLDASGTLVNPNGLKVYGWPAVDDDTNPGTQKIQKGKVEPIVIKSAENMYAPPDTTKNIKFEGNFSTIDGSEDDGIVKTITFYDTLGNKYTMDLIFKYDTTTDSTDPRWVVTQGANVIQNGDEDKPLLASSFVMTPSPALIRFDKDGYVVTTGSNISSLNIAAVTDPTLLGGQNANTAAMTIDLSKLTQFQEKTTAKAYTLDGHTSGTLNGFNVGTDGIITGTYSNGVTKKLGQIAVAQFKNPAGLEKIGDSLYTTTPNSGEFDGIGEEPSANGNSLRGGALEMSTVDLSREFTEMITTQRGFQANSRIISVSDEMLQELVNLKR